MITITDLGPKANIFLISQNPETLNFGIMTLWVTDLGHLFNDLYSRKNKMFTIDI